MSIKKKLKEIDKFSPYPLMYSFIMTKNERKLFDKTIEKSKGYLEFGMGGSTFEVLKKSRAKIYSIDSSLDWIKLMREYWLIKFMENKRLKLFHVDIGPTGLWGMPIGTASRELYPNYSAYIFNIIEKGSIDTVLVDGRFRVACTLKTILECYTNDNLKIIIHDFWDRPNYNTILNYLESVERVDTLGVFKIKHDIDLNLIKHDYDVYKFDPS